MNLIGAIYAIRRYGCKGTLDYLIRHATPDKLTAFLHKNCVASAPLPGITIIGTFDQPTSLSKVLRDLAQLLQQARIPYQALNIPGKTPIPQSEFIHLITPQSQFVSNKYDHVIAMRQTFDIPDPRCRQHAIEFWEFEDGFKESQPETMWLKNIIAMSDFNCNTFKKHLPHANINKILYPFQFSHDSLSDVKVIREKYGIRPDTFMVFFNFDFQSSYYRKNPEGILHAFKQAFSTADNATIVFKTMRAKPFKSLNDKLHAVAQELQLSEQLITIDDFIPQEDLVNLTNACDVYISLHLGEGFGLGIAEAMALGKPAIVTNYSATTEFCTTDNAQLIPYKIVPVDPGMVDADGYRFVTHWAEPDIPAAAKALRKLYDQPNERARLGANAQSFIREYFSVENFRKSIESFLRQP